MNSNTKQRLLAVLGLVLLATTGYGSYLFIRYVGNLLLSIDKQVAAAIIASSGTVLAAVGVALYVQRRTKDRELAEAHRPQKIELL